MEFIDLIWNMTVDEFYYWLGLAAAIAVFYGLLKITGKVKKGGES